jgi:hypothetical protein
MKKKKSLLPVNMITDIKSLEGITTLLHTNL